MARKPKSPPSRVEQARLRAEAAAAGNAPRSLAQAAAVRTAEPKPPRRWPAPVATAAAAVVFMTGWYSFGPTTRVGGASWPALTGSLTLVGALIWLAVRHWPHAKQPTGRATAAVSLLLSALFVVGAANSIVIDGQVKFSASDTAEAVELIHQIRDDLVEIASYDELMRLDTAVARVEIDRFRPGADRLAELAGHYASYPVDELPSDSFIPVMRQVATAADFGSRALEGKRDLTLQHDARLEANVNSWRETYTAAVLTAGPGLGDLSTLYGIQLVDPDRDPVE